MSQTANPVPDDLDPMKLLQGAQNAGNLGQQSMHIANKILQDDDLGQMMMEALSTPPDQIRRIQQTILTIVVDDSYSIRENGLEAEIRNCVNLYLDAMKGGELAKGVLVAIVYLNGTVLTGYVPLEQAPKLDASNYQATGKTPLFDVSAATLLSVIAEAEKLETQVRANVRTWTFIVTDGQDWGSHVSSAADVAQIATEMYQDEGKHIIRTLGLGSHHDWRSTFGQMGIPDQHILTVGSSPKEMRAAFGNESRFTKTAMGQQQVGFSKQAMAGGFGNP